MKKEPFFSVVTVCLNASRLEHTCESIVNQAFQDFEWIVIDGGSGPETVAIFEKYRHRMDYFVSEKDSGIFDAMNKGIEQAKGSRVNFLNAGDFYADKNVLQTIKSFADSFSDVDVLHGKIRTDSGLVSFATDEMFTKYMWVTGNIIPHQAIFYKRNLFSTFGKYRTDYVFISDGAFNMLLFFNNCSFKHVDCIVANYDTCGKSAIYKDLSALERERLVLEFFTEHERAVEAPLYERKRKIMRKKSIINALRNKITRSHN